MITQFNHLTIQTKNNRISDIEEVTKTTFEYLENLYKNKNAIILDGEPYLVEFVNIKEFLIKYNEITLIKCNLYLTSDFNYEQIKNDYNINNSYPILAVDIVAKTEKEIIILSKITDWIGDFERCVGHFLMSKIQEVNIN